MKMKSYIILAGIMVLCLASFSTADVIVETKTDMDMIGAGKVGMEQIQYIKGDRSYDKNTTKLPGKMADMAGGENLINIQIVRFDKGVSWALNPDKKSYTEYSLDKMKTEIANAKQRNKDAVPMSEYEWKTEISKDIGTEKILDFECEGIRAVAVGVNKNDSKDSVFITNEQWFSDELPGGDEFTKFTDNMVDAIGDKKSFINQMSMNPMLAKLADQFGEIAKEFESIKGVPLKTVLIVEGTINPMAEAMGDKELDAEAIAMMEKMGIAVPDAASEGEHHNLISVTSTVTKIEKKSIDDSQYEIPEGYKKQ